MTTFYMRESDDPKDESYLIAKAILTTERYIDICDLQGKDSEAAATWFEKMKLDVAQWRDYVDDLENEEGDQ